MQCEYEFEINKFLVLKTKLNKEKFCKNIKNTSECVYACVCFPSNHVINMPRGQQHQSINMFNLVESI